MSCNNCDTPQRLPASPLPLVSDDYARRYPTAEQFCCDDPEVVLNNSSEGSIVPHWAMDASCGPCKEGGMTLLARVGNRMARFAGSGFIQIVRGKARLVNSIQVRVTELWHEYWRGADKITAVAGKPLPAPYLIVGDPQGWPKAIRGLADDQSIHMWNPSTEMFDTIPVSEIPKIHKGLFPRANRVELLGVEPLNQSASLDSVRSLKALTGSGILIVTQEPTVPEDDCQTVPGVASVATFLEAPSGDGVFVLKYSQGTYGWVEEF